MSFRDFSAHNGEPQVSRRRDAGRGPVIYACHAGRRDAVAWLKAQAQGIERDLGEAGAVLLRGFGVRTPAALDQCLRTLYGEAMSYRENTSLRTPLLDGVRTSTDHPADQWIEQHSEQSYSRMLPARLLMACVQPAQTGGETPLADTRRILARLPEALLARLRRDGYLYRAHFRRGFRPNWRETYLVEDRAALEEHLSWAGIDWRWTDGGDLVTQVRRPAVVAHPDTGEPVWFNHILFWHPSSLEPGIAAELVEQFGPNQLPHAVFHGDGTPFSDDEIAAIRAAHRAETWMAPWQAGDLLLLDNLLSTHGRAPYAGARQVMFAMARPLDTGVGMAPPPTEA